MANYEYACNNEECVSCSKIVTITKPMAESGRIEYCEKCNNELSRNYTTGGIKTGDGFKH